MVFFVTGFLYQWIFSAENLFVESIGIPLQQMARVVVTDGEMDETEKEFLDALLPLESYGEYYTPFLADPIKWAPEFDTEYLDTHKQEFFSVWWSLLKKNFGTYVEQYLMGTYGFWHICNETKYEFIKEDIVPNDWGLWQSSFFENHLEYPMKEKLSAKYDYISTGLLVWIVLFDVILCWMKKRSEYILPFMIFVGNWATLMIATPTAFGVRYVYICVLGLPLLLIYGFMIPERKEMKDDGDRE